MVIVCFLTLSCDVSGPDLCGTYVVSGPSRLVLLSLVDPPLISWSGWIPFSADFLLFSRCALRFISAISIPSSVLSIVFLGYSSGSLVGDDACESCDEPGLFGLLCLLVIKSVPTVVCSEVRWSRP